MLGKKIVCRAQSGGGGPEGPPKMADNDGFSLFGFFVQEGMNVLALKTRTKLII